MMNYLLDTQEMKHLKFSVVEMQMAVCPTCNDHSEFTFCGAQKWPERIAKAAGFPEVLTMWQCQSCDTTLLEPNLNFDA